MIGVLGRLSLRSCHLPLGCCDRARAKVVETLARVVQAAPEQVHVTPMSIAWNRGLDSDPMPRSIFQRRWSLSSTEIRARSSTFRQARKPKLG